MKQVRQRTALIILLIALLAAGMALFCIFYFVHGADWASFSANAHAAAPCAARRSTPSATRRTTSPPARRLPSAAVSSASIP